MAPETTDAPRPDDAALRQQIEALLMEWVSHSLSHDSRRDLVERVLQERSHHLAADVEALARRVRAEAEAEVRRLARAEAHPVVEETAAGRHFTRLSLVLRLQHLVLLSSCVVLILTGLPIKFHDTAWAAFLFNAMGGIQNSSLVHRIGAVALAGVGLFHVLYLILTSEGRWNFVNLIPGPKDGRDALQMVQYFLGRTDERPRFDRFSYVEKFDYWAVYWGMVIMVGSGCLLWFENITLQVMPKYMLDIAKEAHSDEALLATLAIIIWHFYNVHLNPRTFPMNRVWLTGKLSEAEMIEEHPLEYERLIADEERNRSRAS
ncbi:MAG: cytochrome b/b6 domain-containing protein [Gemmatimonadota bacterium]